MYVEFPVKTRASRKPLLKVELLETRVLPTSTIIVEDFEDNQWSDNFSECVFNCNEHLQIVDGISHGTGNKALKVNSEAVNHGVQLNRYNLEYESIEVSFWQMIPSLPTGVNSFSANLARLFHSDGQSTQGNVTLTQQFFPESGQSQRIANHQVAVDTVEYNNIVSQPGEWEHFRMFIRNNTSGLSDGIFMLWYNDELINNTRDAVFRTVQDSADGLGLDFTTSTHGEELAAPFTRYIDDIHVKLNGSPPEVTPTDEQDPETGRHFYIDPVLGSDNNPGTQAQPWATYRNIVSYYCESCGDSDHAPNGWVALQPGDTVHFLPGNYDTAYRYNGLYYGLFFRNVHGSDETPIRLVAEPGAILSGVAPNGQQMPVMYILQSSHFDVSGFEVTNGYGGGIRIAESIDVSIHDNWVHDIDGVDNNNIAGVSLSSSVDVNVFNNLIHDNYDRTNSDTNGGKTPNSRNMVIFRGDEISISRNKFFQSPEPNSPMTGPGPVVKHAGEGSIEISRNHLRSHWSDAIGSSNPRSHIFNNLIIDGGSVAIVDYGGVAYHQNNVIENNTILTRNPTEFHGGGLVYNPTDNYGRPIEKLTYRENIVYDTRSYNGEQGIVRIGVYMSDDIYEKTVEAGNLEFDENIYFNPNETPRFNLFSANGGNFGTKGGSYTFNQWQSLGYDTNSLNSDPLFDDVFYPQNAQTTHAGFYDDAGARLTVFVVGETLIAEGRTTQAAVVRSGQGVDLSQPLVVALHVTDSTEVDVPTTVTIPAGQYKAYFSVRGVIDNEDDFTSATRISATADGFDSDIAISDWVRVENQLGGNAIELGGIIHVNTIREATNTNVTLNDVSAPNPVTVTIYHDSNGNGILDKEIDSPVSIPQTNNNHDFIIPITINNLLPQNHRFFAHLTSRDSADLTEAFSLTLLANQAPVITAIANQTLSTGQTLTIVPTVTEPENDGIRFAFLESPEGATVNPETGEIQWTATNLTTAQFTLQATDDFVRPKSSAVSFTVTVSGKPGPTELLAPSNVISDTSPTYRWTSVPGAEWYQLSIHNTSTNTYVGALWLRDVTTYTPVEAMAEGSYRFWVQTYGNGQFGEWSSPLDFTIEIPKPSATELISPTGTITTANPTFTWQEVENANYYQIYVQNKVTNAPVISQWVQTTSYTHDTALSEGMYQFWVRTWGNNKYGDWSAPLDFAIEIPKPETAVLVGPIGETNDNTPTFEWNSAEYATWYYLHVVDNNTRKTVVGQWIQQTTYSANTLLGNGSYTFYVLTWGHGKYGDWSNGMSFRIDA